MNTPIEEQISELIHEAELANQFPSALLTLTVPQSEVTGTFNL